MTTVESFDPHHHQHGTVSRAGSCAQGGRDTCGNPPVFSVLGSHYRVAACDEHLAGAARQALGLPPRT
jgi:hypothetical protein